MFTEYLLLKGNIELSLSLLKISDFIIEWSVDWLLRTAMVYVPFTLLYLVKYWLSK